MVKRVLHQPIATARFEAYGGPPGKLDVADIVTQANSETMAAGLCTVEGGPFAYRCDYEALCVALDDNLTWETADGSDALRTGDIVAIPKGGRAAYAATAPSRFFYATFPVNWPEIVGWKAGEDIKDLSAVDDLGSLDGVMLFRRSDAEYSDSTSIAGRTAMAKTTGPQDGFRLTIGYAAFNKSAIDDTAAIDAVVVPLDDGFWLETEGTRLEGAAGDLFFLPGGPPLRYGSDQTATVVSVSLPAY